MSALPGTCPAQSESRQLVSRKYANTVGRPLRDRLGGSRPSERPTGTIVIPDEGVDFLHQVLDAGEGTTANGALGDETKPAFPPGWAKRNRRGVVHVIAGPLRQPSTHLGVFVGDVAIDDQVKVPNRRQRRFSYELFITAHCRYGHGASAHHKSEAPRHEPAL